GPKRRRSALPLRPTEARLVSVVASPSPPPPHKQLLPKDVIPLGAEAPPPREVGSIFPHAPPGPITVIRGYAETLLEPSLGPGEVQARASLIMEAVDRLERMTGETLDFARGGGRVAR